MRKTLIIYAGLAILLQVLAAWLVHRMYGAWLDTFIYRYLGFAVRSVDVHWMTRLSRLSLCAPLVFIAAGAFIIAKHKSDKALLHTLMAGLTVPVVIVGIGLSLFLAELKNGTWEPNVPEREDSQQPPAR